ncbi:hypothetical protein [Streptomyces chartreusis]|uniref:hypothetical protein n=1 Tax=Streptomyces chartreusis TaxID=1969 RepID=UPI0036266C94
MRPCPRAARPRSPTPSSTAFGSRRVPPTLTPAPADLDVAGGLRAWTVLTTAMGVFGFGLTAALRPLV